MALFQALGGAVGQGVLWGLMTLGVFLTFRVLNIADMTVDGSFAAGGAVSAVFVTCGFNPYLTLLLAAIVGSLTGLATGVLNTKLKINVLLASILTQIALYSVNIRIMCKSNISLLTFSELNAPAGSVWKNLSTYYSGRPLPRDLRVETVISMITDKIPLNQTQASLLVGVVIVAVVVATMYWFFGTEYGAAIRAAGGNEQMARALGVDTDATKIIGLMISNALIGISGALVAQAQGYADVSMGQGAIVVGLASIIIGEAIFGNHFGFWYVLLTSVLGSIIYRVVIAVVLQLGLKSTDLKLLTALIVAAALSTPVIKSKLSKRRHDDTKSPPDKILAMTDSAEENTRNSAVIRKDGRS